MATPEQAKRAAYQVIDFARGLQFRSALNSRNDADLWRNLVDDLSKLEFQLFEVLDPDGIGRLFDRATFVNHMLKAFKRKEHFIVAKLSYSA